jgi:hypothetical protein
MAFESALMGWIVIEILRYRCPAPLSDTRRDPRHYKYTSDHKVTENSTDIAVLMTKKTVISANTSDSSFNSGFYKTVVSYAVDQDYPTRYEPNVGIQPRREP